MKRNREDAPGASGNKRATGGQRFGAPAATAAASAAANTQGLTTMDALSYLREVKEHFKNDKAVYDVFLEIMKEFKARRIDTSDVIKRVKDLFQGHDNLILGFNTFVPKGYEIKIEDVRAEAAERERLEREAAARPAGRQTAGVAAADNKGKRPVEYDQAFNYVNKIRTRFRTEERVYNAFLEILNMYRKGQKSISQVYSEVAMLFKDHSDLLEEFEYFLPDNTTSGPQVTMQQTLNNQAKGKLGGRMGGKPGSRGDPRRSAANNKRKTARGGDDDDEDDPRRDRQKANLGKELQFFEKVKARLRNREAYQDLLKSLNLYNQEIVNRHELQTMISDILGRAPDLIHGFNEFLERCESMDLDLGDMVRGKDGKLSLKDMAKVKDAMGRRLQQVISNREKFHTRPISELDLSDCERCGPSYRLLPKGFPKAVCSDRTELCMEVLNDNWVNVTTGSEDYSFKQMRKNQYEESLFRCEDDRFELDMVIETNESTLKVLSPLNDQLAELSTEEKAAFKLQDDTLNAVQLRCVERIYGEHGMEVRELLVKNPAVAIPVVLTRLKQKDDEWRKTREEMNKVWAEVYLKNYHKSLDHRSFYFKQLDKKSTSQKGMLAEIREVSEKRKREEEGIIVAAAANRRPLYPDLKWQCNDPKVHDDVYSVLKFSLGEWAPSAEMANNYLHFYRNFLEPFMRMPQRDDEGVLEKEAEEEEEEAEADEAKEAKAEAKKSKASIKAKAEAEAAKDDDEEEADEAKDEADMDAMDDGGAAVNNTAAHEQAVAEAAVAQTAAPVAAGEEAATPMDVAAVPAVNGAEPETAAVAPMEVTEPATEAATAQVAATESAATEDKPQKTEVVDPFASATGDEDGDAADDKAVMDVDDDEAGDAQLEESYRTCKPLASAAEAEMEAAAAATGAVAVAGATPGYVPVFYAHDALYLFFRLHQHLYERMAIAHQEAAVVQARKEAEAEANGTQPPAEPVLATFFAMLYRLLEGVLEPSTYEDECRALLGNNAYMLFTLDKLVFKLMKQMQSLHNDELSLKLLKLHSYERARGAAFRDDVYHANACVLLHEEPCYRVEYSPTGELSLQLMEGGPDKSEVSLGAMDTTFAEYLSIFLQTQTGASDKSGVFLSRNLQGAAHAEQEAALADVCVYNGLECKISCNTSKVSYVLDTEDLFHRRRRGLKAKATRAAHEGGPTPKEQAAAARFHEFVEKHAGQAEVMVQ